MLSVNALNSPPKTSNTWGWGKAIDAEITIFDFYDYPNNDSIHGEAASPGLYKAELKLKIGMAALMCSTVFLLRILTEHKCSHAITNITL